MRFILGSASPRRKEILNFFDLPFEQIPSHFDEDSIPYRGDPQSYVINLAEEKAKVLDSQYKNALILTADTIVTKNGKIYGKPESDAAAFEALSELVGQWHSVYTAVSLCFRGEMTRGIEETRVLFNPLTPEEIKCYIANMHLRDKAGSYAIQYAGGIIVQRIEGCYTNVMGLPVNTVRKLLHGVNINLWQHLRRYE